MPYPLSQKILSQKTALFSRTGRTRAGVPSERRPRNAELGAGRDVHSLQPFGTLLHFKLNLGAVLQSAVSIALNCGVMNKHIVTTRALDETVTF